MGIISRIGVGYRTFNEAWDLVWENKSLIFYTVFVGMLFSLGIHIFQLIIEAKHFHVIFKSAISYFFEYGYHGPGWFSIALMQLFKLKLFMTGVSIIVLYVLTIYSGLVYDAFDKKPLRLGYHIKTAAARILRPLWLLFYILVFLLMPFNPLSMFIYPLLGQQALSIPDLYGRALKLFLSNIPEIMGAIIANIFAFLLYGIVLIAPMGLLLALVGLAGQSLMYILVVPFSMVIWYFIASLQAATAAVPAMLTRKAQ